MLARSTSWSELATANKVMGFQTKIDQDDHEQNVCRISSKKTVITMAVNI